MWWIGNLSRDVSCLKNKKTDIRKNADCCVQIECDVQPFIGEDESWRQGSKGERNLWYEKLRIEEV